MLVVKSANGGLRIGDDLETCLNYDVELALVLLGQLFCRQYLQLDG